MTMAARGYKTKKALKGSIGQRLTYSETSMFGPEYPEKGTGIVTLVGPDAYTRKWFAEVTLREHLIIKVS